MVRIRAAIGQSLSSVDPRHLAAEGCEKGSEWWKVCHPVVAEDSSKGLPIGLVRKLLGPAD